MDDDHFVYAESITLSSSILSNSFFPIFALSVLYGRVQNIWVSYKPDVISIR